MSLLTRAQYWLARTALKASALSFVPAWTRSSFLEPSFRRLTREGYQMNAAVHICITKLALAYQQPPLIVVAPDGEPIPTHPLQQLISRPNPMMGWRELALFISTYKAIGGQAYLWKQRSGQGRVVALWPLHAGQVSVVPGSQTWIDRYEYDPGDGDTQAIERQDIVHLKWPAVDPDQPWQSLPPLRAIAREVDTDAEATRYMYALLANDAAPRTVLQVPGTLTDPAFQRLQAQFTQRHGGDNRGNVAVVEGGATISRFSLDMQELAFDTLRSVPEARIAAAFLIPAEYSGLTVGLEHSTYANVSEARRGFFEDTITQLCALDASELATDLGPEFGGNIRLEHDFSKVVALQENEEARWTRALAAVERGVLDPNEARVYIGFREREAVQVEAKAGTPILGYHIESGVVSKNEARAQLGLAPEDESQDEQLRRLQSLLTVTQAAVNVGIPLDTALGLVGLQVALPEPIDVTPQALPDGASGAIGANTGKGLDRRPAARKAAPSETIERRMERALVSYLTAQYTRAAEAVAAGG